MYAHTYTRAYARVQNALHTKDGWLYIHANTNTHRRDNTLVRPKTSKTASVRNEIETNYFFLNTKNYPPKNAI